MFEQNTNKEVFEVHYFLKLSQYYWNFAKESLVSDLFNLFGKVSNVLALLNKVVNFRKFLICVLLKI